MIDVFFLCLLSLIRAHPACEIQVFWRVAARVSLSTPLLLPLLPPFGRPTLTPFPSGLARILGLLPSGDNPIRPYLAAAGRPLASLCNFRQMEDDPSVVG